MPALTCGQAIVKLLESYGVDTVMGIPGVHSIELYRGLSASSIRHITPRHEQGAGFMADGYARASGKPGVCFIITGPGMTNIATAMGQALQDSVPMLVISSVSQRAHLGMGEGRLHELPDQRALLSGVSVFSHTLLDVQNLPRVLARAFAIFSGQRPGPVHIEIPIDLLRADASGIDLAAWPALAKPLAAPAVVDQAARLLLQAQRPLLIVGGGAVAAGEALAQLAELVGIPVLNTTNGKGIVPPSHPLAVGGSPSCGWLKNEIEQNADVVLALGTELGETDYDFFGYGDINIQGKLIRVDIDAQQLYRAVKPEVPILADGAQCAQQLLALIKQSGVSDQPQRYQLGCDRAAALRAERERSCPAEYRAVFAVIDRVLPDCLMVGDSCQLTYYAQMYLERQAPRQYFHSATGFGTLGYAIPAAQGARLAKPDNEVLCLIGDGGGQFTLNELSSAVEAHLKVIFLVWNNSGHGEIRRYMDAAGIAPVGVNIHTPDYVKLAQACGCQATRADSLEQLETALGTAVACEGPFLIDVTADRLVTGLPFSGASF
ncbi:MAG: 5-guanidino-2-oxopentanoate decarboxylase [Gammaproteobacteria bacterium]|nr:5-guanidino-2-oxopentanoate decarboxylase [Gammaproteobacteria bacterium]